MPSTSFLDITHARAGAVCLSLSAGVTSGGGQRTTLRARQLDKHMSFPEKPVHLRVARHEIGHGSVGTLEDINLTRVGPVGAVHPDFSVLAHVRVDISNFI